jgi:hypothetical protein
MAWERQMKNLRTMVLASPMAVSAGAAMAQPGSGMRSMKTYEECKAYQDQHHEQMAARAKERGGKALAMPRRDACGSLRK